MKKNQVVTANPFIYCNLLSAAAPIFKQSNFSMYKHVTINNKIQLIIMDAIQSYYTLSNKNNLAGLMSLFNIGL